MGVPAELEVAVAFEFETKYGASSKCWEAARDALDAVPPGWCRIEGGWSFIDPRHVVEYREDGWALQHPVACRPDLLGCEVHKLITADAEERGGPPRNLPPGRYYATLCDLAGGGAAVEYEAVS